MPRPKNQRNEFAEMYVAGIFADDGWSVYFPREDKGFDFLISKKLPGGLVIRPVQVKGKYPESLTTVRPIGHRGPLTAMHPHMVLAIPLFTAQKRLGYPDHVAYIPMSAIRSLKNNKYFCAPALLKKGAVSPRPSFNKYFDEMGLAAVGKTSWG